MHMDLVFKVQEGLKKVAWSCKERSKL